MGSSLEGAQPGTLMGRRLLADVPAPAPDTDYAAAAPVSEPDPLPSESTRAVTGGFTVGHGCTLKKNTTLVGGTLLNGYLSNVTTWGECCAMCFRRGGCTAWMFRGSGPQHGCYLKGKLGRGYTRVAGPPTDISGTVTTT